MKNVALSLICTLLFSCLFHKGFAQSFWEKSHLGIGAGVMQFQGDIKNPSTKFALQGMYTYELTGHINIRGQLFFGSLGATDASSPPYQLGSYSRPHPFHTAIQEASLLGELNLFNLNDGKKWTPYGFIGIGYFHYRPKKDDGTDWGIKDVPRKLNVPFGLGLKFALSDNIRLFAEGNYRYTTTDEVDGYQPTDIPSYRGSKINDYYLSGTIGLTFRLGGDYRGSRNGGGRSKSSSGRKGCPPVYL